MSLLSFLNHKPSAAESRPSVVDEAIETKQSICSPVVDSERVCDPDTPTATDESAIVETVGVIKAATSDLGGLDGEGATERDPACEGPSRVVTPVLSETANEEIAEDKNTSKGMVPLRSSLYTLKRISTLNCMPMSTFDVRSVQAKVVV